MQQNLAQIALVVRDYDEAIAYFTQVFRFELLEDTVLSPQKRWVVVRPKGSQGCSLLLAKAADEQQSSRIGNQTGGRVFLFLYTDDLDRDAAYLSEAGVRFLRGPLEEPYGKVMVVEDLYGNKWDWIERKV
ncbi:MAG: VOC family protein [Chitinophagales bacterium]|jgi:catechol 2,3-dioxygenase-like lactoylglutathione lyase family enzyme